MAGGIQRVLQTGITGLAAAKAGISTAGHNISNANTEGFSRQRVGTTALTTQQRMGGRGPHLGEGVKLNNVDRINDHYIEKQMRNTTRDLSGFEEKEVVLGQLEDIFNEMGGEGLNRFVSRFFNEFRKLANEPESEAIRQSVRESSSAMVSDFRRLRQGVEEIQAHVDSRIEGYVRELNASTVELKDLNLKIREVEASGGSPNDLLDRRDLVLKKIASTVNVSTHYDNHGMVTVELKGIGPLVIGPTTEKLIAVRTPETVDEEGRKSAGSFDIKVGNAEGNPITSLLKGGRLGALIESRDKMANMVLERLDALAFGISTEVNKVHQQGVTRDGFTGVNFFKPIDSEYRASAFFDLSDDIKMSVDRIASALEVDAPGDNRVAVKLSQLQGEKILGGRSASLGADGREIAGNMGGIATVDDWYNSIVSDIGVMSAKNKGAVNQQRTIMNQLTKIRDQVSGVSIDEETTMLMQYQQSFAAAAKVIQVGDEMLETILSLKR